MTARTSAWERVENATVGSWRRGYLMLEGVRILSYGTLLCEAGDRRDVGVRGLTGPGTVVRGVFSPNLIA